MDIEIAKHGRMSQTGSSLLRLIQNEDMPTIDLLVRESIQNSADAAAKGKSSVDIDFNIREFETGAIAPHFKGISRGLMKRFSGSNKLIEIRDCNTTGLLGPIEYSEVKDNNFGNLLKLIYEISMPQQEEGSGGSWGLGKTVYFRVGIGLVIYYTRIKDVDGTYKSRLAGCLVENEMNGNALIEYEDESKKRGIAWWGEQIIGEDETKPLTDEGEIKEILDILGVEAYKNDETGTSIIIPFIDEKKLLEGIYPYRENNDVKPHWLNSLDNYIDKSVQRWYAPRVSNLAFASGKQIKASVNGNRIYRAEMLPVFKVIQELYNKTSYSKDLNTDESLLSKLDVKVEKIQLQKTLKNGSYAGEIAFVKLNKRNLLMGPPNNNPDPFTQINEFTHESEENSPIIAFIRKPGMIVSYETVGPWVDGIGKTNKDEYIIGLFVPDSKNIVDTDNGDLSLEEYFRRSEKADHTSWSDWSINGKKHTIVNRVQRGVKNKINKEYDEKKNDKRVVKKTGISRILADVLLPPENFGNSTSSSKPGGSKAGGSSGGAPSNKPKLKSLDAPRYKDGKIYIPFEVNFSAKVNTCQLELNVVSESGHLRADEWESSDGIGTNYPIEVDSIFINKIKLGDEKKKAVKSFSLDSSKPEDSCEGIKIKRLESEISGTFYGADLEVIENQKASLIGEVVFVCKESDIQMQISLHHTREEN